VILSIVVFGMSTSIAKLERFRHPDFTSIDSILELERGSLMSYSWLHNGSCKIKMPMGIERTQKINDSID
jgi:hypothetical protein